VITPISLSKRLSAGALALVLTASPALAAAAVGPATEWTQLLNNMQLLEQSGQGAQQLANQSKQLLNEAEMIMNQLDQYRAMLQNLERLPDEIWGDAAEDLQRLQQIVQQGEGIAFSMGGLDDILKQRFPSFEEFAEGIEEGQSFSDLYAGWSDTNRDTISGTLAQAGLQYDQFQSEQGTLRQLQAQSETAVGQMQALQVGHSIASEQVGQLQKLRGLVAQQSTMMGTWYQSEQAGKDLAQQKREDFFAPLEASGSAREMEPRW
jgi:P-type conjugative transfer protein TrbJ